MTIEHIEFVHRTPTGIHTIFTCHGATNTDTAAAAITAGTRTYSAGPDGTSATVTVRDALGGQYLYANWDGSRRNNLHDLAETPAFRTPHYPTVTTYTAGLMGHIRDWVHRLAGQGRDLLERPHRHRLPRG